MPFREAHSVVGNIVCDLVTQDMEDLDPNIDNMKKYSDLFEEDIYEKVKIENSSYS